MSYEVLIIFVDDHHLVTVKIEVFTVVVNTFYLLKQLVVHGDVVFML